MNYEMSSTRLIPSVFLQDKGKELRPLQNIRSDLDFECKEFSLF